jgi:hypothetical protein
MSHERGFARYNDETDRNASSFALVAFEKSFSRLSPQAPDGASFALRDTST